MVAEPEKQCFVVAEAHASPLPAFPAATQHIPVAGPFNLGKFTYVIGTLGILWVFFITALFVLPTVCFFDSNPLCSKLVLCGLSATWLMPS